MIDKGKNNIQNKIGDTIVIDNSESEENIIQEKDQYKIKFKNVRHFVYQTNNMLRASFSFLADPSQYPNQNQHKIANLHVFKKQHRFNILQQVKTKINQNQIKQKYLNKDYVYFYQKIFHTFEDKLRLLDSIENIAYLDIQSNGLRQNVGDQFKITTIVLFDEKQIKYYVNGINLQQFKKDILKYKAVVTFNGDKFDIKQIKRYLNLKLNGLISFDLMTIYRELFQDYRGLKLIKKDLRIQNPILKQVDGKLAIKLWEKYQTGDENALKMLLAYNAEDVIPLRYISEYVCQELRRIMKITNKTHKQENKLKLIELHQQNLLIMDQFMDQIGVDKILIDKYLQDAK